MRLRRLTPIVSKRFAANRARAEAARNDVIKNSRWPAGPASSGLPEGERFASEDTPIDPSVIETAVALAGPPFRFW
jgi:hypothetical protein